MSVVPKQHKRKGVANAWEEKESWFQIYSRRKQVKPNFELYISTQPIPHYQKNHIADDDEPILVKRTDHIWADRCMGIWPPSNLQEAHILIQPLGCMQWMVRMNQMRDPNKLDESRLPENYYAAIGSLYWKFNHHRHHHHWWAWSHQRWQKMIENSWSIVEHWREGNSTFSDVCCTTSTLIQRLSLQATPLHGF